MKTLKKKLKDKAWKLFSEYIRRKDADFNGFINCYCGKILHWKDAQASHLVDGRMNSILFDERGVYPSCVACNMFKGGNKLYYMKFLEHKLGVEKAIQLRDELLIQSKQVKKMRESDYQELIDVYTLKLKELDNGKTGNRVGTENMSITHGYQVLC